MPARRRTQASEKIRVRSTTKAKAISRSPTLRAYPDKGTGLLNSRVLSPYPDRLWAIAKLDQEKRARDAWLYFSLARHFGLAKTESGKALKNFISVNSHSMKILPSW